MTKVLTRNTIATCKNIGSLLTAVLSVMENTFPIFQSIIPSKIIPLPVMNDIIVL
jgi:hypothetical protein